jgi:hypothetical protein
MNQNQPTQQKRDDQKNPGGQPSDPTQRSGGHGQPGQGQPGQGQKGQWQPGDERSGAMGGRSSGQAPDEDQDDQNNERRQGDEKADVERRPDKPGQGAGGSNRER